ncbi:MAG: TolC family protein, partial [Gemmataceae bacterium]
YLAEARSRELQADKGMRLAMAALREAMGVDDDFCFTVKEHGLPRPKFELCQEQIVELALGQHGEMLEALAAAEAFGLEVEAQARMFFPSAKRTGASSSDIHAQEVPLGEHNGDYRPGAVALEMPVTMFGLRRQRVAWAEALSGRADAVAVKTRNLIRLDAINAYLRWEETAKELVIRAEAADVGRRLAKRITTNLADNAQNAVEFLVTHSGVAARSQARYNEALYNYVLALADLERVTAGGFQPGLACPE